MVVPKFVVREFLWWTDVGDVARELIGKHSEQNVAASIRKTIALVVYDTGVQLMKNSLTKSI